MKFKKILYLGCIFNATLIFNSSLAESSSSDPENSNSSLNEISGSECDNPGTKSKVVLNKDYLEKTLLMSEHDHGLNIPPHHHHHYPESAGYLTIFKNINEQIRDLEQILASYREPVTGIPALVVQVSGLQAQDGVFDSRLTKVDALLNKSILEQESKITMLGEDIKTLRKNVTKEIKANAKLLSSEIGDCTKATIEQQRQELDKWIKEVEELTSNCMDVLGISKENLTSNKLDALKNSQESVMGRVSVVENNLGRSILGNTTILQSFRKLDLSYEDLTVTGTLEKIAFYLAEAAEGFEGRIEELFGTKVSDEIIPDVLENKESILKIQADLQQLIEVLGALELVDVQTIKNLFPTIKQEIQSVVDSEQFSQKVTQKIKVLVEASVSVQEDFDLLKKLQAEILKKSDIAEVQRVRDEVGDLETALKSLQEGSAGTNGTIQADLLALKQLLNETNQRLTNTISGVETEANTKIEANQEALTGLETLINGINQTLTEMISGVETEANTKIEANQEALTGLETSINGINLALMNAISVVETDMNSKFEEIGETTQEKLTAMKGDIDDDLGALRGELGEVRASDEQKISTQIFDLLKSKVEFLAKTIGVQIEDDEVGGGDGGTGEGGGTGDGGGTGEGGTGEGGGEAEDGGEQGGQDQSLGGSIRTLQEGFSSLSKTIGLINEELASTKTGINSKLEAIETHGEGVDTKIGEINSKIAAMNTIIGEQPETSFPELEAKVNQMEKDITGINAKIDNNVSEIGTLKTGFGKLGEVYASKEELDNLKQTIDEANETQTETFNEQLETGLNGLKEVYASKKELSDLRKEFAAMDGTQTEILLSSIAAVKTQSEANKTVCDKFPQLQQGVAELKTSSETFRQNISDISKEVGTNKTASEEAASAIVQRVTKLEEANSGQASLGIRLGTAESKLSTLEETVEGAVEINATQQQSIENLLTALEGLTASEDQAEEISSLKALVQSLETLVQNKEERISSLEALVQGKDTRLSTLESTVSTLSGQVSTLSGQVSTFSARLEVLEGPGAGFGDNSYK